MTHLHTNIDALDEAIKFAESQLKAAEEGLAPDLKRAKIELNSARSFAASWEKGVERATTEHQRLCSAPKPASPALQRFDRRLRSAADEERKARKWFHHYSALAFQKEEALAALNAQLEPYQTLIDLLRDVLVHVRVAPEDCAECAAVHE